jgi:hypothetical protein
MVTSHSLYTNYPNFFPFLFIPNYKMKAFWKVFFHFTGRQIIMMLILCIVGKRIKDEVHWQNYPNSTPK